MDTCICMPEALHCSPKTITILSIDYNPIQKFFLKYKIYDKNKKIFANCLLKGIKNTVQVLINSYNY